MPQPVLFWASLLLLFLPIATPLSFAYNNFSGNNTSLACSESIESVCLEGDATVDQHGVIQLTRYEPTTRHADSLGRAVFSRPFQLWDRASRDVSSFTTKFVFAITSEHISIADGMAFFLTHYPHEFGANCRSGCLGLVPHARARPVSGARSFMAVELDTYHNLWDPGADHVGINVNSISSEVSEELNRRGFTAFSTGAVQIEYKADQERLFVKLTYDNMRYELFHDVDLKSVLPERVSVGFTATTSGRGQQNKLLFWDFRSSVSYQYHPDDEL